MKAIHQPRIFFSKMNFFISSTIFVVSTTASPIVRHNPPIEKTQSHFFKRANYYTPLPSLPPQSSTHHSTKCVSASSLADLLSTVTSMTTLFHAMDTSSALTIPLLHSLLKEKKRPRNTSASHPKLSSTGKSVNIVLSAAVRALRPRQKKQNSKRGRIRKSSLRQKLFSEEKKENIVFW